MRLWLERRVPVGTDLRGHLRRLAWALAAGLATNLHFLLRYTQARCSLYHRSSAGAALLPGAVMEPFGALLGWSLYGCFAAAAAMAPLALWYWRSHWRGSRSIYLMRRLPDRRALWRRCLTLPLLGAAAYLAEALLLLLLDLAVYRLCTPAGCLPLDWM